MNQLTLTGDVLPADFTPRIPKKNPLCPFCGDEMVLDGLYPLQLRCVDCGACITPSWTS